MFPTKEGQRLLLYNGGVGMLYYIQSKINQETTSIAHRKRTNSQYINLYHKQFNSQQILYTLRNTIFTF